MTSGYKIPRSVLVLIHTPRLEVLLLERAQRPGFWQSVTGSQDEGEGLPVTARREVREETGIDAEALPLFDWRLRNEYSIFLQWRSRYGPGVTRNTEHVFSLEVPRALAVTIAPHEHTAYRWAGLDEAAQACFSWSNRDALRLLPRMLALRPRMPERHC